MFHESSLFCLEYTSLEKVWMTQYLIILKKDIMQFVTNTYYCLLVELQSNANWSEIELQTQAREGEMEI